MRAHTKYGGGEWSEEVLISYGSILGPGKSCNVPMTMNTTIAVPTTTIAVPTTTIAVPTTMNTTAVELSGGSLLRPALIAVGVVLAAIVLVTLGIIVVVCSNISRRKRKLKHALKRQVWEGSNHIDYKAKIF